MQPRLFFFAIILTLSTACSNHLYSPLNTNINPYIPTSFNPGNKGSKVETYAGVGFAAAASTEDPFYYGALSVAQSRSIRFLRVNYGANILLGNVQVSRSGYHHAEAGRNYREAYGGNLFSGAYGGNGSVSFVLPNRRHNNAEWRILGCLLSAYHEFGTFSSFRSRYPANDSFYAFKSYGPVFVDRKLNKFSAGLFSEFEVAQDDGGRFGCRFAWSMPQMLRPEQSDYLTGSPYYFSATIFGGKGRYHGFLQTNFSEHVHNLQIGMYYQIGSGNKH